MVAEYDRSDAGCIAFLGDSVAMSALNNSITLESVNSEELVAVYFPGGHGPMFDLAHHPASLQITREVYEAGGIVGAVCHGTAGIVNLKLSNGTFLVSGKNVTGFSNTEEDAVQKTNFIPFMLEDQLKTNGGNFSKAATDWAEHVLVDGRLVTGQNPASTTKTGLEILSLMKK